MDVCDAGAGPSSVVGVVADGKEADAFFQGAGRGDLAVEVVHHGDVHGFAARVDPVET